MDLPSFLRALKDIGFNNGLALDLYKYDYEAVAKESITYFHDLLSLYSNIHV